MAVLGVCAVLAASCSADDDTAPDDTVSDGPLLSDDAAAGVDATTTVAAADVEAVLRERAALIVELLDDPDAVPTDRLADAFTVDRKSVV